MQHHGKITKLTDRNSGFIRESGVKEELFFDASDLAPGVTFPELHLGDSLSYVVTKSLKGPYATNVSRDAK